MNGSAQNFNFVLQDFDFLAHLCGLLSAGLNQIHTFVALVFDDVVGFGEISQSVVVDAAMETTLSHLLDLHFLKLLVVILDLKPFALQVLRGACETLLRLHKVARFLLPLIVL